MVIWSGIVALLAVPAAVAVEALPPGTVTLTVVDDGKTDGPEVPAIAEAVGDAFNTANYLVLPATGPSRYRARVAIVHETRGLVGAPAGTKGPAASVANWGAGVQLSLPTQKQDLRALIVTRMTITLTAWRDGRTLWTGSAVTAQVGGTQANAPAVVGAKLAGALVSRMPAVLEGPLSVP
ncbi:hypothetical protein SFC76_16175 [Sphingomonas sp. CD22]|uniref:hypothetical protein n=1 Tax=Sphingomonas sp. CD22 TaxID=3100214 RepID=UPI002ADFC13D|nr:hypothetical protein [Sphingomonas sp. CD22]MEA1085803.1 hypothetical protein [Sphingomonas sp. CD22]